MAKLKWSTCRIPSPLAVAAVLLGIAPVPALGQASPGWVFSVTPNVWPAGHKGQVGIGASVAEVDLTFGDVIEQISLGLMGVFEARHGGWIGRFDGVYISLSDEQAVPTASGTTGTVTAGLDQVILQPEVGYMLLARPWGGIDGLVGVRYWHISTEINASAGGSVGAVSGSQEWVDGTVGGRIRFSPAPKWRLFGKGDIGGGGSKFSWQAIGGAAFTFAQCCSAVAAYRHLDVDYESGGVINDVYMTGPALGIEIGFGGNDNEEH